MNSNLIKTLSEQARNSVPKDTYDTATWIARYNEKLTELIINECVKVCEQGIDTQTTSSGAATMIKQHFEISND
jgi:hypothetical protein